jgi:hypothetical protein
MKRPIYDITINGVRVVTKNSWNSACREMPKQIAKIIPSGSAREVSKSLVKLDRWTHKSGVFQWQGSDGAGYEVRIDLRNPEDLTA